MQKVYQRINWENDPSKKTPINEDNLNRMDYAIDQIDDRVVQLSGYQGRVEQSEANAKKHANDSKTYSENAKQSEDNAKQSELKAKQYAEQAFSGTPEGYAALIEQVESIDIKTSNEYDLFGTKQGGYRLTDLVGATEQNGEPTPTKPIAIENYADSVEMISGYYNPSDGTLVTPSASAVCNKHSVSCNSGDVVKIVTETELNCNVQYYGESGFISSKGLDGIKEHTYTVPSGATRFNFYISSPLETVGKITLTVNGKYVGQIVEKNKNLFDKTSVTKGKYIFTNGSPVESSDWNHSDYIPVKANTKYTLQSMNSKGSTNPSIALYDENKNYISLHKYSSQNLLSFTTTENARYVRLSVCSSDLDICQLEEGEVATPYEPYQEKITTFYLTEPLRDTDRIVRVDGVWYEEHKRRTKTLTSIRKKTIPDENDWTYYEFPSGKTIGDVLCDKLSSKTYTELGNGNDISSVGIGENSSYPSAIYINVGHYLTENTVEAVNTWLEENPITVEYKLATPTLTPLDTASQLALNDMVTFDGMTYIEVDSKVKPTSIKGEHGTSQVGAYTLQALNKTDSNAIKIEDAINTMLLITP